MVRYAENMDDFLTLMEESKNKLVVIDFTATWCGPCRFIAPVFEKLATENPEVIFIKVDVDEADDIARSEEIQAMPTFRFYRNGSQIDELRGADQATLTKKVAQHK